MEKGSFVAVSTGILLSGHISVRSKSCIVNADIVFSLMPHQLSDAWLESLNENVVSLQKFYKEGRNRQESYELMVEAMLSAVRKGKNVCGAFYGHAGVFAWSPHEAVKKAKEEGFYACMEPGVSADACLYADLNIDPGAYGVQSYEASQFMLFGHVPNNKAYLLLWQVALAGEVTAQSFEVDSNKIKKLVEYLGQWYSMEHEVILYEAAFLPIEKARESKIKLKQLQDSHLELHTTLVIPPESELTLNQKVVRELGISESSMFINSK